MRVLLVLLLLLVGCSTRQAFKSDARPDPRAAIIARDIAWKDDLPLLRFDVPYVYGAIRLQVEECLGRRRDGWPLFYVAPKNPLPGHVLAFYDERNKAVVFALGNETIASTIAHELIHWTLAPVLDPHRRRDETPDEWRARVHPDSVFSSTGKCSHLLNPGR